jgi:membrane fusion protein (multidrug efflux system)
VRGLGILLAAASLMIIAACEKKDLTPHFPPPDVGVVQVIQKDVPVYGDWVATMDGYTNAQIQPQVSGYLLKQDYREGSFVRKGDVLFEIDPRPFQAVLDQAKGQLAQAKGQLAQAHAQLGLANINVNRDTPLAKARAIAQSQLDNDIQTKAQDEALVQTAEAAIQASEAAVETAELNLGFTKVRSLLDGIAGIATTQIGNLVANTTVLTTVSTLNPIKVYFPISEQEYLGFAARGGGDPLRGGKTLPLQLTLANGDTYPHPGHIIFADRSVDPQTGTIRIAAAFPNPGNVLRPGQFARVRAVERIEKNALLVPQRAVSEMQGTYQVAVLTGGNKASLRKVTPGVRDGSLWVIDKGLEPGDQVIADGTSKVRDGAVVNPKPVSAAAEGKGVAE